MVKDGWTDIFRNLTGNVGQAGQPTSSAAGSPRRSGPS